MLLAIYFVTNLSIFLFLLLYRVHLNFREFVKISRQYLVRLYVLCINVNIAFINSNFFYIKLIERKLITNRHKWVTINLAICCVNVTFSCFVFLSHA